MEVLMIPTNKGNRYVLPENIIRVEASSSYSKIYFEHEPPLTVAKVLQWFEEKLPEDSFYRIHRGHIVNRTFITRVFRNTNKIVMANGDQLLVSKRRKMEFRSVVAKDQHCNQN